MTLVMYHLWSFGLFRHRNRIEGNTRFGCPYRSLDRINNFYKDYDTINAGIMRKTEAVRTNQPSNIQCLEVLIPRSFIANGGHSLFRTLSLYSLHNHPIKSDPTLQHSEIFHFMVFDWKRTIKHMLEDRKIPYTVLQFFAPDTIYYETIVGDLSESVHSRDLAVAV